MCTGRRILRWFISLLLVVALWGCSSDTAVLVTVAAEPGAMARGVTFRLEAFGPDGLMVTRGSIFPTSTQLVGLVQTR